MIKYEYKDDSDREMLTATTLADAITETEASLREQATAHDIVRQTVTAEVIEWVDGEEGDHHDVIVKM